MTDDERGSRDAATRCARPLLRLALPVEPRHTSLGLRSDHAAERTSAGKRLPQPVRSHVKVGAAMACSWAYAAGTSGGGMRYSGSFLARSMAAVRALPFGCRARLPS